MKKLADILFYIFGATILGFILACFLFGAIKLALASEWAPTKKPLRIAIIDTGLTLNASSRDLPLCDAGHADFTNEGLQDKSSILHGTNIAHLIHKNAGYSNGTYCLIIIKVFTKNYRLGDYDAALTYLEKLQPDIINISMSGSTPLPYDSQVLRNLLDNKTLIFVAAGNEGLNLDKNCNAYPACVDKRLFVIGNLAPTSNYGSIVDIKINGQSQTAGGVTLSGTSQSTAIATGLAIAELIKKRNRL